MFKARGLVIGVLFTVVLLAAACGGQQEGTVRGTVTQAVDPARPLDEASNVGPGIKAQVVAYALERAEDFPNQEIYVKGLIAHKQITADDGTYSFALTAGDYVIEVWVKGHELDTRQIQVKGGRTTVVDWNVVPRP